MKTTGRIHNPDDTQVTLTMTMSIKKWLELRDQLEEGQFPAVELSLAISSTVNQIRQVVYGETQT